ncbi:Arylsulfatase A [Prosthecobacter debontii]|uniref:Arylsulfatase A n=1 Tax=Prosthecobacter debontii TaxID=48467 RepID=A0A1T4XRI7_9BACT|nr:sulfatase [Prosthecobacter debontii]SKA92172.1 Arylsulfatase A [Prosthecobacter debontii]
MKPFFLCALALYAALSSVSVSADETKPNILFILVDDFGARDLSGYGSTLYETPNMDKLAASGAKLTQAYVAYPRCVPSRYAIMTGKYPARVQGLKDSPHVEPGRDSTFGAAFQAAGYRTFYCGKWHLGDGESNPDKVGYETTVAAGAAGATRSHFAPYTKSSTEGGRGKEEKDPIVGLDDAPKGEYLTDRLTSETIKFIENNADQPFCAVLAHYAVHTPIEAKKHLTKRYQSKLDGMPKAAAEFEKESAGENSLVQNNATYAAMIESVDHGVGRLLNTLDRLGIADKTIVILASDHGGLSARGGKREVATSNRPLRAGKGHLYEGGLRIPLLVRWPGKTKAGTEIAVPVITTDLYPTLLDMAGLPLRPQEHLDGVSLTPLLQGGSAPARQTFYWHNPAPRPTSTGDLFSSAIRDGDLKLVEFPEEKRIELYDLKTDVEERTNLASERPEDTQRLLDKLHAWKKEVGASEVSKPKKSKAKAKSE